jgi:hypothetical protein
MLLVKYDTKAKGYVCATCKAALGLEKGEHECKKRPWQGEVLDRAVLLVAVAPPSEEAGVEPWILHDVRHPRRSYVTWDYIRERLREEQHHAAVEDLFNEHHSGDTGEDDDG